MMNGMECFAATSLQTYMKTEDFIKGKIYKIVEMQIKSSKHGDKVIAIFDDGRIYTLSNNVQTRSNTTGVDLNHGTEYPFYIMYIGTVTHVFNNTKMPVFMPLLSLCKKMSVRDEYFGCRILAQNLKNRMEDENGEIDEKITTDFDVNEFVNLVEQMKGSFEGYEEASMLWQKKNKKGGFLKKAGSVFKRALHSTPKNKVLKPGYKRELDFGKKFDDTPRPIAQRKGLPTSQFKRNNIAALLNDSTDDELFAMELPKRAKIDTGNQNIVESTTDGNIAKEKGENSEKNMQESQNIFDD
jgi:hypothetical protein